jgi:hypothetical protein
VVVGEDIKHLDRRLGRHTLDSSCYITVKDEIAHHQHSRMADGLQKTDQSSRHGITPRLPFSCQPKPTRVTAAAQSLDERKARQNIRHVPVRSTDWNSKATRPNSRPAKAVISFIGCSDRRLTKTF